MSQSLILIDGLSSVCWKIRKKKREREREIGQEVFFPELDMPYWLCHPGFSQVLGAVKG
jgi:hypothetical protein